MYAYEKTGYLNQEFRIFHLKSKEQKEYDFHYHDFHKVIYLISGDITYSIEGKNYQLQPNDFVLVSKGEVHRPVVHSDMPYERIILYISPELLHQYSKETYDLENCFLTSRQTQNHVLHVSSPKGNLAVSLCHALVNTLSDTEYASELHQRLLFLEFLVQLNRIMQKTETSLSDTAVGNEKILAVLTYINTHLSQEITIDFLAEHFFTSRYYLMHSFKQETGYTIGQYLTTKRLLYAQELIKNDMPVSEACLTCGFQNYSTFSRAYKKHFGVSPTEQKSQISRLQLSFLE